MLRRKITDKLLKWKQHKDRLPLIIKGCRQCGKTRAVQEFARENYEHVIYINFFENSGYADIFKDSLEVDFLTMMITAQIQDAVFETGKTVIILDEIQECPEARTALKFFKIDGRYDVIATGSLLGVSGYGTPKSIPVGYETILTMVPMDFEEFLWANGIDEKLIALLKDCITKEKPVPEALHSKMRMLLLQYTVVGGMPAVVQNFVDYHNMAQVLQMQRDIIMSYEDDMMKYADDRDKVRIRKCFRSIPKQLAKENKKFQYSVIERGARSKDYDSCLSWIEDAGILHHCYNLSVPALPLDGNAEGNTFKVYMADTGLFVSMLEDGTQADILQGSLLGYKGAIFENLVADFFGKMERKLYYFHKNSGLEIDFVIRYKGEAVLVEVKASNGNAKSMKQVLSNPDRYHVKQAIKLADAQIGRNGPVLTLPLYMGAFLTEI
ncbi:MAG: AAA family ATPase [Schwartzia succinivorans]|nr:AAA family ATPase [Schwartzia succinivorans]